MKSVITSKASDVSVFCEAQPKKEHRSYDGRAHTKSRISSLQEKFKKVYLQEKVTDKKN